MQPVLGTAISWLLSTYTILSLLSFHFASASSCLAQSTFSVNFEGECTYTTVAKGVGAMLDETCTNDASDELQALLGASSRVDAKQKVDTLCQSGYKAFKNDNTKKATFQTSALPEGSSSEDGGSWLKMWGIGALSSGADYGHLWSELQNQNAFYIKRDCLGCVNSHKTIIYKRLTPVPSGLNLFDLFTKNWFSSPSNVLNTDFKLYSTMEDALNDANAWTRCNYNDNGVGFPRDCGPNSLQGGQWSSTTRGGQADVAFYSFRSAVIGEKRDIQLRWPQQITGDPKYTERLRTAMLFALALSDDDFVNGLYFVSTNMMRITNQACARFTIAEYWTFTTTSATLDKSIIQKKNCDSSTQNDSLRSFFTSITTSEYLVKLVNIAGSSTIEEYGQSIEEVKQDYETTKIITPTEDAYVRSGSYSGKNYGGEDRISVKSNRPGHDGDHLVSLLSNSPGHDGDHLVSLLQFYVGSINAGCAKLKLYVKAIGPAIPSNPATVITVSRLYASSSWLESDVTYDNVMPLTNVEKVGTSHSITQDLAGSWIEFDVTDLVVGDFVNPNGWLLLVLDTPEGDELLTEFASREVFDKKPYLEINTQQSCYELDITKESADYSLIYKLDIPETANFNSGVDYAINQVDSLNGYGFDRVAYRMDLESERYGSQSLWVSFDAHTTSLNQLGVPNAPSGAVFQEGLSNMNVISTIPGLNGKNLNGNIEFWPSDYGTANTELVPGASDLVYDYGDKNGNAGSYGSMQIHSSDLSSTLFALNRWNYNNSPDVGIGNNPESTNTDWTNQENAGIYTKRELSIYARMTGDVVIPVTALVRGTFDRVITGINTYTIAGWVCAVGYTPSIDVHVYLGGPAGSGTIAVTGTADLANEEAVSEQCEDGGVGTHRFRLTFNAFGKGSFVGSGIYVHGIAGYQPTITKGNGQFVLPTPPTINGHFGGIIATTPTHYIVGGWVCALGYSESVRVHINVGSPVSAFVEGVANLANEEAVAAACQDYEGNHRFSMQIPRNEVSSGQGIQVNAIAGTTNPVIYYGSGEVTIP